MPNNPTNDPYQGSGTEPSRQFITIAPSDVTALAQAIRGLYIGGAGNVTVKGGDGVSVVFTAVPVGTTLPIVPTFIMATGTTATLMIGLT